MAVRDALLALLADGPKHGYELKSQFDDATGEAWPLNIGQVYTTLQRLERDSLVEAVGEPAEGGRHPYQLTAAGREDLNSWVGTPVEQTLAMRDEVSLKVLLAVATNVLPPLQVIGEQRDAAMAGLQSFVALKRESAGEPLAKRLHLDRLTYAIEAEIRWLETVENRLLAEDEQSNNAEAK
jgi:DNA-binding PadR family transcriptional regulator